MIAAIAGVAAALAEMKPARIEHMILVDSPPTAGTTFTLMTRAYLTPVIGEALSHFRSNAAIRRGLAQGFAPDFVVPEKFVADLKQLTYPAFRTAHAESVAHRTQKPTYERLAEMKPTPRLLAIFGSRDAIVPPEAARYFERVPGTRVAMIEGAGHSPIVEAPARTLELIDAFLKEPGAVTQPMGNAKGHRAVGQDGQDRKGPAGRRLLVSVLAAVR